MRKNLSIISLVVGLALFILGTVRTFSYGKEFADFTYTAYQECTTQYSAEICALQQNQLLQSQLMENTWYLVFALAIPLFSLLLFTVFEKKN